MEACAEDSEEASAEVCAEIGVDSVTVSPQFFRQPHVRSMTGVSVVSQQLVALVLRYRMIGAACASKNRAGRGVP